MISFFSSLSTRPKEELIFMVVGDSISAGRGEASGPILQIGQMKEFNGINLIHIASGDVSTAIEGSPWPQFAITLDKLVLISCNGSGGSEFYPNGDNNNWYTSGTLYAAAKTKTDALLMIKDRTKPDGVLMILGINDARGSQTLANIKIGMDSLITRLNTDYDTPNIFLAQIGRAESGDTTKVLDVRKLIFNTNATLVYSDGIQHGLGLCQRYSNVHMAYDQMPNFTTLGYMTADNLHPNQQGNNAMGSGFANYFKSL